MNALGNDTDKPVENPWEEIEKVHSLWNELRDVPVDDDGMIQESFKQFPVGTDREDIWHWFEEEFNVAVSDLMGLFHVVDMIASGYEWVCPRCEHLNHEIEVPSNHAVTCDECKLDCIVDDYHHALP